MPLLAPPSLLPALAVLPGVLPWQMLSLLVAGTLLPSLTFMSGGGSGTSSSGTASSSSGGGGGADVGGGSGSGTNPGQLPSAQASLTGAGAAVLPALAFLPAGLLPWQMLPVLAGGAVVLRPAFRSGSSTRPWLCASQSNAVLAIKNTLAAYIKLLWPLPCAVAALALGSTIMATAFAVLLLRSLWYGWQPLVAAQQQAIKKGLAVFRARLYFARPSKIVLTSDEVEDFDKWYKVGRVQQPMWGAAAARVATAPKQPHYGQPG
jgi:hypothetical protein